MYPFESRRNFLAVLGGTAAAALICRSDSVGSPLPPISSRFKLSVITDEITQDFGRAVEKRRTTPWRAAIRHCWQLDGKAIRRWRTARLPSQSCESFPKRRNRSDKRRAQHFWKKSGCN